MARRRYREKRWCAALLDVVSFSTASDRRSCSGGCTELQEDRRDQHAIGSKQQGRAANNWPCSIPMMPPRHGGPALRVRSLAASVEAASCNSSNGNRRMPQHDAPPLDGNSIPGRDLRICTAVHPSWPDGSRHRPSHNSRPPDSRRRDSNFSDIPADPRPTAGDLPQVRLPASSRSVGDAVRATQNTRAYSSACGKADEENRVHIQSEYRP